MILGHREIISDLTKLAGRKQLSHGYIFFGPPMVGKKTVALSLANFLESGEFSPQARGVLIDGILIGPDENKTIGIDKVREVRNFLSRIPIASPCRTVIIDACEFLTPEAQSALLKIVEEPPLSGLAILVIDDPERLLPTLHSRLQKIYFGAVRTETIRNWLVKEFRCQPAKAKAAAKQSFGRPGLAYALLYDEKFKVLNDRVRKFFKLSPEARKNFIKGLAAEEGFDFDGFLGALALEFTESKRKNFKYWHELMRLRRNANYFNLNPRLQLTVLADKL